MTKYLDSYCLLYLKSYCSLHISVFYLNYIIQCTSKCTDKILHVHHIRMFNETY